MNEARGPEKHLQSEKHMTFCCKAEWHIRNTNGKAVGATHTQTHTQNCDGGRSAAALIHSNKNQKAPNFSQSTLKKLINFSTLFLLFIYFSPNASVEINPRWSVWRLKPSLVGKKGSLAFSWRKMPFLYKNDVNKWMFFSRHKLDLMFGSSWFLSEQFDP